MDVSTPLSSFLSYGQNEFASPKAYLAKIDSVVDKLEDESVLSVSPTVSIWMSTYNHERFIRQALDSILMQQTSFPFEIVIGDDKSTDQTRDILIEYQKQHPNIIRLRLSRENLYSQQLKQSVGVLNACRGRYVALCEGDDYWTNIYKLQKQVDLLESHPDLAICFHAAYASFDSSIRSPLLLRPKPLKERYQLEDLLVANYMYSPTVMFRNISVDQLPVWYFQLAIGDWPLHILNARFGNIGYIDELMAVYRIHGTGIFSGASEAQRLEAVIQMYRCIDHTLDESHKPAIKAGLSRALQSQAIAWLDSGDLRQASSCLRQSLDVAPPGRFLLWCGLLLHRLVGLITARMKVFS